MSDELKDANPEIADANASPKESELQPHLLPSGSPDLSEIRGIYFDLDDTLCAYWEASKFALRRAFEDHGPEGYTADEMVQHWAVAFREFSPTLKHTGWYDGYLKSGEATRTEQMRLTLLRVGVVDDERAERLSETYMRERDGALRLFEDAEDVLRALKGSYPLGLITNGPADIQRQEIATLGVEGYFDHILIEGEMGEGKPKPAVFERAASLMSLQPRQLLFVGNSYSHDVEPALEAGWRAIWVRRPTDIPPSAGTDQAQPEQVHPSAPKPDAIIGHLRDLLPMMRM